MESSAPQGVAGAAPAGPGCVSRGLLAASGIALAALLIAVLTIRSRRDDFGGPEATNQPRWTQPVQTEHV